MPFRYFVAMIIMLFLTLENITPHPMQRRLLQSERCGYEAKEEGIHGMWLKDLEVKLTDYNVYDSPRCLPGSCFYIEKTDTVQRQDGGQYNMPYRMLISQVTDPDFTISFYEDRSETVNARIIFALYQPTTYVSTWTVTNAIFYLETTGTTQLKVNSYQPGVNYYYVSVTPSLTRHYTFVLTKSDNRIKIYVNGALLTSTTMREGGGAWSTLAFLQVGMFYSQGFYSNVRYFPISLTASEVASNYQNAMGVLICPNSWSRPVLKCGYEANFDKNLIEGLEKFNVSAPGVTLVSSSVCRNIQCSEVTQSAISPNYNFRIWNLSYTQFTITFWEKQHYFQNNANNFRLSIDGTTYLFMSPSNQNNWYLSAPNSESKYTQTQSYYRTEPSIWRQITLVMDLIGEFGSARRAYVYIDTVSSTNPTFVTIKAPPTGRFFDVDLFSLVGWYEDLRIFGYCMTNEDIRRNYFELNLINLCNLSKSTETKESCRYDMNMTETITSTTLDVTLFKRNVTKGNSSECRIGDCYIVPAGLPVEWHIAMSPTNPKYGTWAWWDKTPTTTHSTIFKLVDASPGGIDFDILTFAQTQSNWHAIYFLGMSGSYTTAYDQVGFYSNKYWTHFTVVLILNRVFVYMNGSSIMFPGFSYRSKFSDSIQAQFAFDAATYEKVIYYPYALGEKSVKILATRHAVPGAICTSPQDFKNHSVALKSCGNNIDFSGDIASAFDLATVTVGPSFRNVSSLSLCKITPCLASSDGTGANFLTFSPLTTTIFTISYWEMFDDPKSLVSYGVFSISISPTNDPKMTLLTVNIAQLYELGLWWSRDFANQLPGVNFGAPKDADFIRHWTFVYKASRGHLKIYVKGKYAATAVFDTQYLQEKMYFRMFMAKAYFDEFRYYPYELTDEQIFNNYQSNLMVDACCPVGYYQTVTTFSVQCYQCETGFYCPDRVNRYSCPVLSSSPVKSTNVWNCTCFEGHYRTGTGFNTNCTACPENWYCPDRKQIFSCPTYASSPSLSTALGNCTCQRGYYYVGQPLVCVPCPSNSFCVDSYSIQACPSLSSSLIMSTTITQCNCDYAHYRIVNEGITTCLPCPIGSWCPDRNERILCPANSTSPALSIQSANCQCLDGFYQTVINGLEACVVCPKGFYCPNRINLYPCQPGYWIDFTGATSNQQCQQVCYGLKLLHDGVCVCDADFYEYNNPIHTANEISWPVPISMVPTGNYFFKSRSFMQIANTDWRGMGTLAVKSLEVNGLTYNFFEMDADFVQLTYTFVGATGYKSYMVGMKASTLSGFETACTLVPQETQGYTRVEWSRAGTNSYQTLLETRSLPNGAYCEKLIWTSPFTAPFEPYPNALTLRITHDATAMRDPPIFRLFDVTFYEYEDVCVACPEGQTSMLASKSILDCHPENGIQLNLTIDGAGRDMNESIFLEGLPPGVSNLIYSDSVVVYLDNCPTGYFCISDTLMPIPCPAGTFRDTPGATLEDQCLVCPPGSYCPIAARTPAPCPSGSYRGTTGAKQPSDCNQCPPGNYCPQGSVDPVNCTQGFFREFSGGKNQYECAVCPAGAFCGVATANPTLCPAGTFRLNMMGTNVSDCGGCPIGHYCPEGSVEPTNCPAGTYGPEALASQLSHCITCPVGKYCVISSSEPTQCPAGLYRNLIGGGSVDECFVCPRGMYCVEGSEQPIECSTGTYNNQTSAGRLDMCISCDAGNYCPLGSILPMQCPQGTYNGELRGTSLQSCIVCPVGSYCVTESARPTSCPAGTYRSTEGAGSVVECLLCPKGYYCMEQTSTPIECPAGTYRGTTGGINVLACTACPTGNFCPSASVTPTNCTAGTFRNTPGAESLPDCAPCPHGEYCPEATIRPVYCPASTYRNGTGARSITDCLRCPEGYYCPQHTRIPIECAAGTYRNRPGAADLSDCAVCPPGSYCIISSVEPVPCPITTYRGHHGGMALEDCTPCPSGHYCGEDTTVPTPCPAGKHRLQVGAGVVEECMVCPPGNYCPRRTTTPIHCSPGTYRIQPGATKLSDCTLCMPGTFSLVSQREEPCPLCESNYYCRTSTQKEICPLHTTSKAGSFTRAHCVCDSGYQCIYYRQIHAVVTLNTTVFAFNNDIGGVRTAFLAAMAAAAGVQTHQVTIHDVLTNSPHGRRLLMHASTVQVHASITGAIMLKDLEQHLDRHKQHFHVHHHWTKARALTLKENIDNSQKEFIQ